MTKHGKVKKPSLLWALLTFLIPISIILYGTIGVGIRPPVLPLVLAVATAAVMCVINGSKWDDLQEGMFEALGRIQIAIAILVMVGMVIAAWIAAGTIPAIIYWGLKLISPQHFLFSCLVLCSIVSVATGTSVTTMGTVGVALLGVGSALEIPVAATAGAVISGAYFGDKMSPISDTTNIAASVCEVPLFQHIYSMLWTTVPAWICAAVVYIILGQIYSAQTTVSLENVNIILHGLQAKFSLAWYAFIPPVLMVALAFKRYPVLPVMMICLLSAVVLCFIEGSSLKEIGQFLTTGYKSSTGIKQIDSLLSSGGIMSIVATILLLCSGVSFGGILERGRVLEVLLDALLKGAKSTFRLISLSVFSGLFINLATGSQLLAVIVPGRAFSASYRNSDIHGTVLSRSCEDTGTLSCPLVPWSVHAFIIWGIMGISAYDYAPYAFLNWMVPVFSILCAATGIGVWRRNGRPIRGNGKGIPAEETYLKEQIEGGTNPS